MSYIVGRGTEKRKFDKGVVQWKSIFDKESLVDMEAGGFYE